jgi:hypothetical protein
MFSISQIKSNLFGGVMKLTNFIMLGMMFICTIVAHAQNAVQSAGYVAIGTLRGGAYNSSLNVPDLGITVPYRLYYPDNTEVLMLGLSGTLNQSGWLHGFMNIGVPLRDVHTDLKIDAETFSESLGLATMYMDFGLAIYPMAKIKDGFRFQPFVQGSLGTYVVADNWWVILLLGLTADDTSIEGARTRTALNKKFDADLLFSYGGGIDYYFSKSTGIKLSFRKLKLNLPGGKGAFNPAEINIGVTGRF